MMTVAKLSGTAVRRVVLHSGGLDGSTARRSAERLLAEIPADVPGMGASAILCVRQLAVQTRRSSQAMQAPSLAGEMAQLARLAARPARPPVPAQATAVLFADRAELLSCLARDHAARRLAEAWWWRVMLVGTDLSAAAAQLWVNEATSAPMALAYLADTGDLAAFVHSLPDAQSEAITQAITRAHGLAMLAVRMTGPMPPTMPPAPGRFGMPGSPQSATAALQRRIQAAVRKSLPEAWSSELSHAQRRLLAVGLSLVRLPEWVRSEVYANELPILLAQVAIKNDAKASGGPTGRPLQALPEALSPKSAVSHQPRSATTMAGLGASEPQPDAADWPKAAAAAIRLSGQSGMVPDQLVTCPAVWPGEGQGRTIETAYGGVLFLANAALALGLYADFTQPLTRGLNLSPWDFLALAAVDLAGPAVRRDPLWALLAELAGRTPGQRPGRGFTPPPVWRLPPVWLKPFAGNPAEWTWQYAADRLVVRHPAGFVVLELPCHGIETANRLAGEMACYAPPGLRQVAASPHRLRGPLSRWRNWVMPYLARRIALAMGKTNWRNACRLLLCLPGKIAWDGERMDGYFALERLPIAVRMAGLDRDPGWIPAAARDLRFHFD